MSQHEADTEGELARVPSLVPGLDVILSGGFLQGGLYMLLGPPGAGKTILGNQILYGRGVNGDRGLFITVLGENHGRMLAHLRPMRFFNPTLLPERVSYISAYKPLEEDGLKGLATLIRREILSYGATMLVLDGMSTVATKAKSPFELKQFTYELETLASVTNCTMLLLTTSGAAEPEHTMVDGLIELRQRLYGVRYERRLLVHKFRGSHFLEGEHSYHITRDGVAVFPRIEAYLAMPTQPEFPTATRTTSGIRSLDAMLEGGLPVATMTAVVGPSGAGKTVFGLQFLAGSSPTEPGLLFGCHESPERLRIKATRLGLGLAAAEQSGAVELAWYPIGEHTLDRLAHELLGAVRRRGVKRLVIDGVSGFQQAAVEPDRLVRFWSALSHELRALGVTTLQTLETPDLVGTEIRVPENGLSSPAEVMILLRYLELRSRLYRLISLFKVREGAFDPTIREFNITDNGIVVDKPFEGVEAVLSGIAREARRSRRSPAANTGRSG